MAVQLVHYPRKQILLLTALLISFIPDRAALSAQQVPPPLDPAVSESLTQGNTALNAGKYEDAEKAFKKAAKAAHDKCAECLIGLAQVQEHARDVSGAINTAAKAIAVAQDDLMRSQGHALRGDLIVAAAREDKKWNEKKLAEAQAEYKAALGLMPKMADYHLRMALLLFKQMHDAEGKAEVDRALELAPSGPNADFAQRLRANPRRGREDFAPDFSVNTIDGKSVQLSSLTGRFVVLDFWATWCPPCRDSVGELRELSKKYPSDRVAILSVSGDSEDDQWRAFVSAKKMDWMQYRDADHHMGKLFAVHGIPCYILIDPDGVIRERIVGRNPQESIVHRLKETLNTALSEPVPPARTQTN